MQPTLDGTDEVPFAVREPDRDPVPPAPPAYDPRRPGPGQGDIAETVRVERPPVVTCTECHRVLRRRRSRERGRGDACQAAWEERQASGL